MSKFVAHLETIMIEYLVIPHEIVIRRPGKSKQTKLTLAKGLSQQQKVTVTTTRLAKTNHWKYTTFWFV
jgi:hypothetical protein